MTDEDFMKGNPFVERQDIKEYIDRLKEVFARQIGFLKKSIE